MNAAGVPASDAPGSSTMRCACAKARWRVRAVGTATVNIPAAWAAARPRGESSKAAQWTGVTPSRSAASRYTSGAGLGMHDFVGGGDGPEAGRQAGDIQHTVYPGPLRIGGDGAGDVRLVQRVEQSQDARHRSQPPDGFLIVRAPPCLSRFAVVARPRRAWPAANASRLARGPWTPRCSAPKAPRAGAGPAPRRCAARRHSPASRCRPAGRHSQKLLLKGSRVTSFGMGEGDSCSGLCRKPFYPGLAAGWVPRYNTPHERNPYPPRLPRPTSSPSPPCWPNSAARA